MAKHERNITVTGANGFVGRHVVARLLEEPDIHVRCLVRNPQSFEILEHFGKRVSCREGDITRKESLTSAMHGAWGVVNAAGYREFWSADRKQFYAINERGAANVFEACLESGVEKVVQVSTPLAWGVPEQIPFNEDSVPGRHPSDYARSKYLGDQAGWRMHSENGLPLTAVYLAAVSGAGDDNATMEVRRVVDGKLPALVAADTTYTYVYVRDAAEAVVRALLKQNSIGRKYLVGDQRATTRDYFRMIGRIARVEVPDRNIPEAWLFPVARAMEIASRFTRRRPVLPLDVLKTTAAGSLLFDCSRSKEELGMRYTPLETALAESVEEIRHSTR